MTRQGFSFRVRLLTGLVAYTLRARPDAALATLTGVVSTFLEVMSLAVLLPLTRIATNIPIAADSPWNRLAELIGQHPTAQFYVTAFFALMFARALTLFGTTVLVNRVTRRINAIFSIRALDGFVRHLRFAEVQKESIGHFVAVAGDEAFRASMIVNSAIRLIPLLLLFVLYLGMISYQSWQVGLGFVLFCLLVLLCLWRAFRMALAAGERMQRQSRFVHTHFIESLSGLRTVRSFNAEDYVIRHYDRLMSEYMHTQFIIDILNAVGGAIPTIFLTGGMLVAIAFFISPAQLALLLPAIVVGIMMVLRLLPLATQTLDVAMRLTSDLKAAENVAEMLEAVKSAGQREREASIKIDHPITSIEFAGVGFRYEDSLPPVLDRFSVILTAGKSYAISGASGAGKSTIVDLLLKFYEPQQGTIRVNDVDIALISNTSLRQHVVLVEQMTRVFFDTIARNIQFGLEAPAENVEHLLKVVGLQDLIQTLPDGSSTMLNFQGSNLSGGQRQRIGLARALLRSGDVLILVVCTYALDHASLELIFVRLLTDYRDKILIFIAHDPFILERVDEIICLGDVTSSSAKAAVAG